MDERLVVQVARWLADQDVGVMRELYWPLIVRQMFTELRLTQLAEDQCLPDVLIPEAFSVDTLAGIKIGQTAMLKDGWRKVGS